MAEIIRGTTPPVTVRFNFEADTITLLYLTIAQSGATVIEKELDDGVVDGTDIVFSFTQAETLLLNSNVAALLQVRFLTSDGAFASKTLDLSVSDVLKDGAIA